MHVFACYTFFLPFAYGCSIHLSFLNLQPSVGVLSQEQRLGDLDLTKNIGSPPHKLHLWKQKIENHV